MTNRRFPAIYRIRDTLIYMLVVATGYIVRKLPRRTSLKLGTGIGDLVYRFIKQRREIALSNVRIAFGNRIEEAEIKRIARCSFHNAGKTLTEFLSLPEYSLDQLTEIIRIDGGENVKKLADEGIGAVAVSAHMGNWEFIFHAAATLTDRFAAIAQSFKNPRLTRMVNAYRTRNGGRIIEKATAVKQTLGLLKKGYFVGILSDQNAGEEGVFVDFFGMPASTTRGPIMFALRTGVPVLRVYDIRQADDTHILFISEPMKLDVSGDLEEDIRVNTAKFTKELEALISRYPYQWLWMHNRWKTKPQKEMIKSKLMETALQDSNLANNVRKILILSDGKPGHYNQSMGIIDRLPDVASKVVRVKFKRKWRDNLLRVATRLLFWINLPHSFIKVMLKWAMEDFSARSVLTARGFDAILSTGSSVAAPNLLLGRHINAKSVACTRPSPIGIRHFHLVILPEHMKPRHPAKNVVMTMGVPNRISLKCVDDAGKELMKKVTTDGRRVIGLLLGGEDPYYSVPPDMVALLCDTLLDICRENNACLAITTSRRTLQDSEDVIKSKVSDDPLCCFLVLASEPQLENPVAGILGISDTTIVTEDSFSMVCESASSGKKIVMLKVARKKKDGHPRRQRVYDLLVKNGYIKSSSILELKKLIPEILCDESKPKALNDAQIAADALRRLIE